MPALLVCRLTDGFAMNELPMDFASERVHHGNLEILVVAEALVAEVLGKRSAVRDRFNAVVELNSNPVSQRNTIQHVEEKCLHCHYFLPIA